MAQIVGGIFTSHVPAIGGAIARGRQEEPYWKPFFDGFHPVHRWLAQTKPDVAVIFSNDHGLNFFLDKLPTFAVGAAHQYCNADEGWGLPVMQPFPGDVTLSWHIIEQLVASEFDVTTCQEMKIDHGFTVPLALSWPGKDNRPVKIVPIVINTVQHPLPSAKRCHDLGRAVHDALTSWQSDERIVVFGTGGLSHQLDGERAGFINKRFDHFCLDNLGPHPDLLTKYDSFELIEKAGTQGVEVLNWIAARGALGDNVAEISRNYHVPISNTAAATLLFETCTSISKVAA